MCIDGRVVLQHLPEVSGELHLGRVEDGEVPHPGLAERLYLSLRVAATAGVDVGDAVSFPSSSENPLDGITYGVFTGIGTGSNLWRGIRCLYCWPA